jgi:hypothetical protein
MIKVFSFIDTNHLIVKANLWDESDKAIAGKCKGLITGVLLSTKL